MKRKTPFSRRPFIGFFFCLLIFFRVACCDLFLPEREVSFTLPKSYGYGQTGPNPVEFRVEITSSSGDFFVLTGKPGGRIVLTLAEDSRHIILAYPIFENNRFKAKPVGLFYWGGVTEEENLFCDGEKGAATTSLAELFRLGYSLPGFNCYRFSRLFYNRWSVSPFAFDFPRIKRDILMEEFSTFSLKERDNYLITLSGFPDGTYYPSDPYLESVTVNSDGVFTTTLYVGIYQYLNPDNGKIVELDCSEGGTVIFFISDNP